MNSGDLTPNALPWRAVVWSLRAIIAIQCAGAACAELLAPAEQQTALVAILVNDWGWTASAALSTSRCAAWSMLVAGMLVLCVPLFSVLERRLADTPLSLLPAAVWQSPLLLIVIAWQLTTAAAAMLRGGPFSEWVIGSQAVRWGGPLVLLLLAPSMTSRGVSRARMTDMVALLRYTAAATFIAHGLKAVFLHRPFVDLLVHSTRNLIWLDLSPLQTATTLQCIGVLDIVAAMLLVLTRWRWAPLYMAAWGVITASSRMTAWGISAYPETLLRAANGGVALTVFLYWWCDHLQRQRDNENKLPEFNQ